MGLVFKKVKTGAGSSLNKIPTKDTPTAVHNKKPLSAQNIAFLKSLGFEVFKNGSVNFGNR